MTALVDAPVRQGAMLVADLGGTHLRLGLHHDGRLVTSCVQRWPVAASLASMVQDFVGSSGARAACFAVAAPVDGDAVRLTNADVSFSRTALQRQLGLEELLVVNDVAALARSVTSLRDEQAAPLGGGCLQRDRPIVVVAPGTGLGVAALVPTRHGPTVVGGEGGQIGLPVTGSSVQVVSALLHNRGQVIAEDLVSGPGLSVLDLSLRTLRGDVGVRPRPASAVSRAAETGKGDTLDVFVSLLAAVAQSHALTFGARGGVVLGGGFLKDLVPVMRELGLRERFVAHPKMSAYLASVPLVVDTRANPALDGAAAFLEELA